MIERSEPKDQGREKVEEGHPLHRQHMYMCTVHIHIMQYVCATYVHMATQSGHTMLWNTGTYSQAVDDRDEVDKSLHVTGSTTSQARSHGTAVP